MAVTQQEQPHEGKINGGDQPSIAENVNSKRQRRPSVRLGDIGDLPAAAFTNQWKKKKNPKMGTLEEEEEEEEANLDNLAIGNWKIKGSNPKRVKTKSNWVSKIDQEGNEIEDCETPLKEKTLVHSLGNDGDLKVTAQFGDDGVELGVRNWLNGLGLGRYWAVFEIHEVDEEVLPLLTFEDLKDMGINAVGSRRKMYCAIQKLSRV